MEHMGKMNGLSEITKTFALDSALCLATVKYLSNEAFHHRCVVEGI